MDVAESVLDRRQFRAISRHAQRITDEIHIRSG
jgi:hypothetical protein